MPSRASLATCVLSSGKAININRSRLADASNYEAVILHFAKTESLEAFDCYRSVCVLVDKRKLQCY